MGAGGSAPPSTLHSERGRPPNGLQRPPATPPLAPATAHGRAHKPAVGRRPSSQPNPEPAQAPTGRGQPVHAHPGPLAPKEPPRGSGLGAGSGRALRDRRAEPRLSRRPHMRSQGGVERAPSPGRQRVSAGQGYGCTEEAAPPLPRPGLVPPHGRLRTTRRPRGDLPARREGRAAAAPGNGNRVRPRLRSVGPEAAPSGLPVSTDPGPFSRASLPAVPPVPGAARPRPQSAAGPGRPSRLGRGPRGRRGPSCTEDPRAADPRLPGTELRGRLPPPSRRFRPRPRLRSLPRLRNSRTGPARCSSTLGTCGTEVAGGAREGAGAAAGGHEAGRVPDAPQPRLARADTQPPKHVPSPARPQPTPLPVPARRPRTVAPHGPGAAPPSRRPEGT